MKSRIERVIADVVDGEARGENAWGIAEAVAERLREEGFLVEEEELPDEVVEGVRGNLIRGLEREPKLETSTFAEGGPVRPGGRVLAVDPCPGWTDEELDRFERAFGRGASDAG